MKHLMLYLVLICLNTSQLLGQNGFVNNSQNKKPLPALRTGDTVRHNEKEYIIEVNKYQNPRQFTKVGPSNGTLMLIGGGKLDEKIYETFEKKIGGKKAKIIAITTANCRDEINNVDNYYLDHLKKYGFTNIEVIHTRDVEVANSNKFSKTFKEAKGVWMQGGGSECLITPYIHTRFHSALIKFLDFGGVIAGTSAGAVVMGSYFETQHGVPTRMGRLEFEGFSFLNNTTIATHIEIYQNSFQENIEDVVDLYYPGLLGIGIEENTMAIVKGDTLIVGGAGRVKIYDRGNKIELVQGEQYQLAHRKKKL